MRYVPINISKEEQEVLDLFIQSLGANIKPKTKDKYERYWKRMKDDMGGIRPLTQQDVNSFLAKRQSSPARAMLKNWIDFMEFPVKMPKNRGTKPRKEQHTIPIDEQIQIIKYVDDHSHNQGYTIAVTLTLECALRLGEVINIGKSDFKFNKWRQDLLNNNNSPCELVVKGKGSRERTVIVSKSLMASIINYMEKIEGNKLFTFGEQQLYDKFHNAVIRLGFVDENGKAKYHPHTLRHTQSTQWYENGIDIMEIRDRLGHSSIATTQLYINPSKEKAIKRWKESKT